MGSGATSRGTEQRGQSGRDYDGNSVSTRLVSAACLALSSALHTVSFKLPNRSPNAVLLFFQVKRSSVPVPIACDYIIATTYAASGSGRWPGWPVPSTVLRPQLGDSKAEPVVI